MTKDQVEASIAQGVKWRCIGPSRGGRVVAVAGDPVNTQVFYFGAVAGGIWKTMDGGTYWENVSDGFLSSASVGALQVAPSDPNVIYAGMGETTIRIDVSYGDGVYKSTDAGKTWTNVGLQETRHIGEIRIHPENPDVVYVAALGHAFGPNKDRGVYRSTDGGKNWEQVLFRSEKAGAIDLTLDPNNPRILFASFWEAYRNFWSLNSGGPGSSIYRSTDGGDTWTELTNKPGLPKGTLGKIGVAAAPAKSGRVWALIEAEEAGLYRSDDGGESWIRTSGSRDLILRPWYFCHIFADPQHADTAYVPNMLMWKTSDGGTTFKEITTPHAESHDLWIDPNDPQRMVQGNDGGATVSFNGGETWSTIYNQLTAQFYRIDTDTQFPYRVYATQQDNSSISVPSASEYGAITLNESCLIGCGESGFIAVKPDDPNIVYIGCVGSSPGGEGGLQHYNHRTKQMRLVNVWPEEHLGAAKDLKYRFPWTFPICFSPHDTGTVYACGNHVFRTRNEGHSWETLSPDLSRNDESKLGASGGLTKENLGAENYGTISTFVESPHQPGVFWIGTDDGLVHTSRNGGQSWEAITPPDLPEWTWIYCIEASVYDPDTVYLSATRYKLDDYRPLLYKSTDGGQSWASINGDYPEGEISRVIRADPTCPGLLYVGSETGIFVSFNDGQNWQRLQGNLPVVPIYDLKIKDGDLVAGTHGRAFWILDDLTPLQSLGQQASAGGMRFFPPRPTYRRTLHPWVDPPWNDNSLGDGKCYGPIVGLAGTTYEVKTPEGEKFIKHLDLGENPPQGAILYYHLDEEPEQPIEITILDANGGEIERFSSEDTEGEDDKSVMGILKPVVPAKPGLNRFVWNLRYPGPKVKLDKSLEKPREVGPIAAPGTYQARFKCGSVEITHVLEILKDPRLDTTPEDFAAQFELWKKITEKTSEANDALNRLRRIKRQLTELSGRERHHDAKGETPQVLESLVDRLEAVENALVQTKKESVTDRLRYPAMLKDRLEGMVPAVAMADARPTEQMQAVYDHLSGKIDEQLARFKQLETQDVVALNTRLNSDGVPALEG